MPFEQSSIEKEKNEPPKTAPEFEFQEQEALSPEQMAKEEKEMFEGTMTKLGRASKKMKALMAGVILTGFLAAGPEQATAESWQNISWGQVGEAAVGRVLKEGLGGIRQGLEQRKRIKEQIKETQVRLIETQHEYEQAKRDLSDNQILDQEEFNLRYPEATEKERQLFELNQKKQKLYLEQRWQDIIEDLEFKLRELERELKVN